MKHSIEGYLSPTSTSLISLLVLYVGSTIGYKWPGDPRHEALERFIYEGVRPDGQEFFNVLGDCDLRSRGPNVTSTTVAATWLRMAYHDSATFNVTDRTGGVDGSIHFELDRAENVGQGLLFTQVEYNHHPTKYISNADIIAIGAAGAVANCGGPLIPIRTGRVDAKEAGLPGVPEPQQDLQTHIEKFRLQGFNATEMIELVACGHTMGGVESKDFPRIVMRTDVKDTSRLFVGHSESFDSTTAKFDTTVVTQYLDGTTQNPLVVSRNISARSDFRIFNSDGNVTMKRLSDPAVFQSRCSTLFEKMLNTVPGDLQLSDPIDVIPAMPHYYTGLQIVNGKLTFITSLRLVRNKSDPVIDGTTVSLYWCDRYGDDAGCKSGFANRINGSFVAFQMTGSPMMIRSEREFRIYPFQAPIEANRSISSFWWEIEQPDGAKPVRVDNDDGEKYPVVQDQLIYVTTLSNSPGTIGPSPNSASFPFGIPPKLATVVSTVVGVRDEITPTRVYVDLFDSTFTNLPTQPIQVTQDLVKNTTAQTAPGYTLYSTEIKIDSVANGPTMDFMVEVDNKVTATLLYQPMSIGSVVSDMRFVAAVSRSVERVPHTDDRKLSAATSAAIPSFVVLFMSFFWIMVTRFVFA